MKAHYVTRDRARKSVTVSIEQAYKYYENVAILVLIEEFGWGVDDTKTKADLRIRQFDILVATTMDSLIRCEESKTSMDVMTEVIFKNGWADPSTKDGYKENFFSMLSFAQMYAANQIGGFGQERLLRFSDVMHKKRMHAASVFEKWEELEVSAEGHVNGYGFYCGKLPQSFFNHLEKFLFRIPEVVGNGRRKKKEA